MWALLGVAVQFAPWPPEWADAVYHGAILPVWSQVTSRVVSAVPGSFTAALVLLALVALVAVVVWPGGRRRVGRALGWLVASLLVAFPLTFGLGYHTSAPEAALAAAQPADYEYAREEVLAALLGAAPTGRPAAGGAATVTQLASCLSETTRELRGGSVRLPYRVKAVPEGSLLRFGFAGFVVPWLLEPHVDSGLPTAALTGVALHELAHSAGYAREAEAEAVALLAGLSCEVSGVTYAAALRAAAALAARLPSAERAAYVDFWPESAVEDLRQAAEAAASYRAAGLAGLAARAYDAYLLSQGTEAGIGDYDRATDILVRLLARRREAAAL
ncbi:MAG TPA: DUF3810 family protein [Trueperaceae bacterium]|nr:DUF3810 family protein [Trueperaceae bacterium]